MAEELTKPEPTLKSEADSGPEGQEAPLKPSEEPKSELEPKADEPKTEEKAPDSAPLAIADIQLPEGVQVDEPIMNDFVNLANKHKVSKELAQELVNLQLKAQQTASEKGSKAFADLQKSWRDSVEADPDLGGPKLKAAQANIGRWLDHYADEEARKAFDLTGAGNHPAIFRALARAGAEIKEGSPVSGSPTAPPRTQAEHMFPIEKG